MARKKTRAAKQPEYLSVKEVAVELHVSYPTALQWVDSGQLPAVDLSPTGKKRLRRVSRVELNRFLLRRGIDNGN